MAILIGAALALLSVGVVLYPFLKARAPFLQPPSLADADDELPDLEAIYESIRILQLEHQLGNIAAGLYREQLDGYRVQAAMVLRRRAADGTMRDRAPDADWALEQEIKMAGAGLVGVGHGSVSCPSCSTNLDAALSRCPQCGADLVSPTPPDP